MISAAFPMAIAGASTEFDPDVRITAAIHMAANPAPPLDDSAIRALMRGLADRRKMVRRAAAEALARAARIDARVSTRIVSLLDSAARPARFAAAYALSLTGDFAFDLRAASALYEALGDADSDVRWSAHDLLLRLAAKDPAGVRSSLIDLAYNGVGAARRMALYCLRDFPPINAQVTAAAQAATLADDAYVRLAGLAILARASGYSCEASAIAARLLESDPNPGVRRSAAATLGFIGEASAHVNHLLREAAQNHSDRGLARAARRALVRIAIGNQGDSP